MSSLFFASTYHRRRSDKYRTEALSHGSVTEQDMREFKALLHKHRGAMKWLLLRLAEEHRHDSDEFLKMAREETTDPGGE